MEVGVRLLGAPSIRLGSAWRDVPLDKRLALLTHLACAEGWVSRERLAYLFWPDTSTAQARINLRQLLARTRSLPFDLALEADDKRLRWPIESDVKAFRQAILDSAWGTALAHYRGELIAGYVLDEASEFANWLEFERMQLREAHRRALLEQAGIDLAAGRAEEAAALYERLLLADPLDETAMQSLLRLLVKLGAVAEARRRLQRFGARLQAELGLAPSAATELLVSDEATHRSATADLLDGPGPAVEGRHARLTAPLTSFVGREAELAEVIERLTSEHCRLLTLLGPGGIGKTRLALRAAKELESSFAAGFVAIPLGLVDSVEAVPLAIAAALGLELRGTRAPLDQVTDHLEARELLLLLDNFEHLVDGALLLQELLTSCPMVKVLVTSRQRLRLQAEWLLPLVGLAGPPQLPADTHDAELARQALSFDAIDLLYQRARQVEPGFTITAATLPAAADICRLLEGLPLGIELAAGWLRVLSLHEVRAALESSLDSLPSESVDSSERHRTLRVTIEHSWNLLSAGERPVFRALAVFHGSFERTAARGVAAAALPQLTALIEKSLLRLTATGRYNAHPIVKRYMRERLDEQPDEAARLRDAHSRYYVNMLAAWVGRLHGKQQPLMLAQFEPDYDNITAAWGAAIDSGMVAECLPAVEPLVLFHGVQGRFTEGELLFATSIERFEPRAASHKAGSLLLATLMVNRAWFLAALARFDEAVEHANDGMRLATAVGSAAVEMRGLTVLGSVASRRGDDAAARVFLEKSLAVAEASNDQWVRGLVAGQLGLLELRTGHLVEAETLFERALRINEELENTPGVVNTLDYLGRLSLATGDMATAAASFERGLALAEDSRFRLRVPYLLTQLATLRLTQGQLEAATASAQRALAVAEELGQLSLQAEALAVLGRAAEGTDEKSSYLMRALALARDLGEMPRTLAVLLDIAQLPDQRGAARELLRLVSEHPAARPAQRDRAKALLAGQPSDSEQPDEAHLLTVEEAVRLLLG